MAQEYGIDFPLLEDKDLEFSKIYAGVSTEGYPFPAVFVIEQDGTIAFQRISSTKDGRVYVPELLAIVDNLSGADTSVLPKARGFAYSSQVRLGLGGGTASGDGGTDFAGSLSLEAMRSAGDHFGIGLHVGSQLLPDREIRAAALLRLRNYYWKGVGEVYLQLPVGISRRFADDGFSNNGLTTGLSVGTEMEISPTFFMYTDLGYRLNLYSHDFFNERLTRTKVELQIGAGFNF